MDIFKRVNYEIDRFITTKVPYHARKGARFLIFGGLNISILVLFILLIRTIVVYGAGSMPLTTMFAVVFIIVASGHYHLYKRLRGTPSNSPYAFFSIVVAFIFYLTIFSILVDPERSFTLEWLGK